LIFPADDAVCRANIESTPDYLNKKHFEIVGTAVVGTFRRNNWLDIDKWTIYYTEGDSSKKRLWGSS